MKTIYKYPFAVQDEVTIVMPTGAKILHLGGQKTSRVQPGRGAQSAMELLSEQPCLWAMVDLARPIEDRHFLIFGTGQTIPDALPQGGNYIGTFMLADTQLVYHMFEVLP